MDFVSGEYHLNGQQLYRITSGLKEELIVDPDRKASLQAEFARFKHKNKQITAQGKLIPDSLYHRYFP
jgi:uncharacterized sulfatase